MGRIEPAPLLRFVAGHELPADVLGIVEDPRLDGFVFSALHNGKLLVLITLNTSVPRRYSVGDFTTGLRAGSRSRFFTCLFRQE
jgi:hypothetical protein